MFRVSRSSVSPLDGTHHALQPGVHVRAGRDHVSRQVPLRPRLDHVNVVPQHPRFRPLRRPITGIVLHVLHRASKADGVHLSVVPRAFHHPPPPVGQPQEGKPSLSEQPTPLVVTQRKQIVPNDVGEMPCTFYLVVPVPQWELPERQFPFHVVSPLGPSLWTRPSPPPSHCSASAVLSRTLRA
jgi:hypothetical protein